MDSKQQLPSPEMPLPLVKKEAINSGLSKEGIANVATGLEVHQSPAEGLSNAQGAVAQSFTVALPLSPSQPPLVSVAQSTTTTSDDPAIIAADNDVIEKQWVDKAREIVKATQGDPRQKTLKLNFLKKDYMEKRYGKIIKIPLDKIDEKSIS